MHDTADKIWRSGVSPRAALAVIFAACLGLSLWAGQRFWERPLAPLPSAILPCVSYAPFRHPADSPFDPMLRFSREQLQRDLQQIRTISPCLRTYGLDQGMEAIPELARSMGLRLRMGVWIGPDRQANRREIARAVALAREYPDVIEMVILGNEVLLRGDLPVGELAKLLSELRAALAIPVTYADVWAFWQRYAQDLLPHTDLVTVHILPYWEDDPVGVSRAVDYVHERYAEMQRLFSPLPVWVGETGWPAWGRARGPALPGVQEQRYFVHGLLTRQDVTPIDFNLIESFDQPWKRVQEGAMGGSWGVFASDGSRRVDWTQSLSQTQSWVFLTGLMAGWSLLLLAGPRLRWALSIGLLIAGLAAVQTEMAWLWSRTAAEWGVAMAGVFISTALCLGLALRLPRQAGGHSFAIAIAGYDKARDKGIATTGGLFGDDPRLLHQTDHLLRGLIFLWLCLVLWQVYWLIMDGRYRPFGWPLLLGPVVFAAAWRLSDAVWAYQCWRPWLLRVMAVTAGLAGIGLALLEGLENPQAVTMAVLLVMTGLVYGLPGAGVDQT
ncbi:MAG: hypothetical protein FJY35_02120 [Betaproteobacteria bacterium]|nr:hypothetical protein [Betaproteobacteria bacterium]